MSSADFPPTFDAGFTTTEMSQIFSPRGTIEGILAFEGDLALALFDLGLADEEPVNEVSLACGAYFADPEEALEGTWEDGTPLIRILAQLRAGLDPDAAALLHQGATTQDAVDSGRMTQIRRGLVSVEKTTGSVARRLRTLAIDHRDQPQMGRTFLQDARPTTFGFRAAMWLSPVLGHIEAMRRARVDLPVQLGGPSGNASEYGGRGAEVIAALAQRMALQPHVPWHTDRSPIWNVASVVEANAQTMAKIATDIALLAQSSVGEVSVRVGGSSSMPEKRNPIDSVRCVAAARAASGYANMLTGAPSGELDRGIGGWHLEWHAVPGVFHTAGAAAEALDRCLENLDVNAEAMTGGIGDSPEAEIDPRLIDSVLERFDEVVESE